MSDKLISRLADTVVVDGKVGKPRGSCRCRALRRAGGGKMHAAHAGVVPESYVRRRGRLLQQRPRCSKSRRLTASCGSDRPVSRKAS